MFFCSSNKLIVKIHQLFCIFTHDQSSWFTLIFLFFLQLANILYLPKEKKKLVQIQYKAVDSTMTEKQHASEANITSNLGGMMHKFMLLKQSDEFSLKIGF